MVYRRANRYDVAGSVVNRRRLVNPGSHSDVHPRAFCRAATLTKLHDAIEQYSFALLVSQSRR